MARNPLPLAPVGARMAHTRDDEIERQEGQRRRGNFR
jgi:hypothetical protein